MLIIDINNQNIEPLSGVYKIYSPRHSFGRLLGQDSTGLLYIGKSNNLRRRLNNLRRACDSSKNISPSKRGQIHVFGEAIYNQINNQKKLFNLKPIFKS